MSVATMPETEESTKEAYDQEFDTATSPPIVEDTDSAEACGHTCSVSCCTLSFI